MRGLLGSALESFKGVLWVAVSGAISSLLARLPQVGETFNSEVVVFYVVLFVLLLIRDSLKRNTTFGAYL